MDSISNKINLTIIWIFTFFPFIGFFTAKFLDMAAGNVMLPFLIIAFGLTIYEKKIAEEKFRVPGYIKLLILFTIYVMGSDYFILGIKITIKYFYLNNLIKGVIILLIIENMQINEHHLSVILRISMILIGIAVIVIIYQEVVDTTFFTDPHYHEQLLIESYSERRIFSIYSWTSRYGIGVEFVPILSLIINQQIKSKSKYFWIWYIFGAVVSFLSRYRWIMLNYLVLFFMLLAHRRVSLKSVMMILIIIFVVFVLSFQFLEFFGSEIEKIVDERILQTPKGGILEGSAGTRILAAEIFLKYFPRNPIFGTGDFIKYQKETENWDMMNELAGRSSHIHVGYLSSLYYYGIVGGSLFWLFIISFLRNTYRIAKKSNEWGAFFALLGFGIMNLTMSYISIFTAGFILAFVFNRYYELQFQHTEAKVFEEHESLGCQLPHLS